MTGNNGLSKSYVTPWTLRVFTMLPGNPLFIGVGFTIGLLLVFFVGRSLVGGGDDSAPDDLRIAITQILITTYVASAYSYLLMAARKTTQDLAPVVQHIPQWQTLVQRAGKHRRWLLLLTGAATYLILGVSVTNATTLPPVDPWAWREWSYDVVWHRATTVFFVWWLGCLSLVTVVESVRLSRLSDSIAALDLLDLDPYQPLIRQGLTNALLIIGVVSVMSLLGIDSRYWPALVGFWVMFTVLAWVGLMLPLRGIRRKIRAAKLEEIDWCRSALRAARDELKASTESKRSMVELSAYKSTIENLRNWPFDNPTLLRFSLYLLIPLGSWLGGAFVERGLDLILS